MAILFSNDLVVVEQTFFGGWKITARMTGATFKPSRRAVEQIGLVWIKVRKSPSVPVEVSRLAEALMFRSFAISAISPDAHEGRRFVATDPTLLAAEFLERAKTEHVRAQVPRPIGSVVYESSRFRLRVMENGDGLVVEDTHSDLIYTFNATLTAKMEEIMLGSDQLRYRAPDVEQGIVVRKVFELCCLAASGNWQAATVLNGGALSIARALHEGEHDALVMPQ